MNIIRNFLKKKDSINNYKIKENDLQGSLRREKFTISVGDELPAGIIKLAKVYIAKKRKLKVGDKMAGRHGNKGVVSIIVPREDMPHMEDGTPVDIVLNPVGVPSRMNVGQILETILSFSGRKIGEEVSKLLNNNAWNQTLKLLKNSYGEELIKDYEDKYGKEGLEDLAQKTSKSGVLFETPIFDSANFNHDIKPILKGLNLPETGTFRLKDGRTGDYFDQPVTVGSIYMMKLNHMVDDKLHARSVGPYSLVTQQPLGGKAQLGGQRFGEMEVWALEAHGASYALQEMLTYKSDDIIGRHKVYEALVRNDEVPEPGLPESFNVLIKELQSLGLRIDLFKSGKEEVSE